MNVPQRIVYTLGCTVGGVLLFGGLIFGGREWDLDIAPLDGPVPQPDPVAWLLPPVVAFVVTFVLVHLLRRRAREPRREPPA